jgi:hypothetical protein
MKHAASITVICLAWTVAVPSYAESDRQHCINQCNREIDSRTSRIFAACLVVGPDANVPCGEDDSSGVAAWCRGAKEARASCDAFKADCLKSCDTKSDKEWWQIWK